MRTIRVTGKGLLQVHPDTTRITMTVRACCREYEETLRGAAEQTEILEDTLKPLGFDRTDLKTLSFDVEPSYESYKEKNAYKQRLIGYEAEHVVKVEFESDNGRLGKILYALANSPLYMQFRLSYTVKDPEAVKNELLAKAIQDARDKAKVLSSAAGLKLGAIQSVDYSWGRIDFEVRPMSSKMELCEAASAPCGSYDMNIEPDDIDVEDTVTVIWEIG